MPETCHPRNRWYDQKPEVMKAVDLLIAFPEELRVIIADGTISLAEKQFQAAELLKSVRSLGTDRVLGLYKAQKKQRKMDAIPSVYKALTYMYILAAENQILLSRSILVLMDFVSEYLRACKNFNRPAEAENVISLTHCYVEQGVEEVRQFLKSTRERFQQLLGSGELLARKDNEQDSPMRERVRGNRQQGMKIQGDLPA